MQDTSHEIARLAETAERLTAFDGAPEEFLRELLGLQRRLVRAEAGAILRGRRSEELEPVAVDPATGRELPPWVRSAVQRAAPVLENGRTQVVTLAADEVTPEASPGGGTPGVERCLLLHPLRDRTGVRGLAAFVVEAPLAADGTVDPRAALGEAEAKLAVSAALLSLYETRLTLEQQRAELRRLRRVCRLAAEVAGHERFGAAATALCDELAQLLGAERASLGLIRGRYVRVRAISGTERIGSKTELIQALGSAMEECADQDTELLHPEPADAATITRAHAELSRRWGPAAVVSLPIRGGDEVRGVLTVERDPDAPFDRSELDALRLAIELIGPRLLALADRDRWFGARAASAARRGLATLVGPRHTWAKAAAVAVAALIGFAVFAEGTYRVSTPFTIEATSKRIVSAPYKGYLESVAVEPGDRVEAGETLGELDASKLRLKRAEAEAERQRHRTEADLARREGKTAEARASEARAEELAARIGLLDWRIERATLQAPIAGVVVAGDLKKKLGSPVEAGQRLFEIAPIEALHAELAVPEGEVADLEAGQTGELATASSPAGYLPFKVRRIDPAAEVVDQRNVFHVRAELGERPSWLRPGMEGQAKVEIDQRSHAWIWTHELIEWVRMKLWL